MSEHNVVIVSAKRTPIGAFQGVLSPGNGPAARHSGRQSGNRSGRHQAGGCSGNDLRLRAAGRPRPGTGAAGCARCRCPRRSARNHHQQDVRLGAQGRDARGGPDPHRRCGDRARGGPRIHDECAVPAAQSARRLPHGARGNARSHVLRRPAEPVRRATDGHVRGSHVPQVFIHARRAGCIRDRVGPPGAARGGKRRLRRGDHAGHPQRPQGRNRGGAGRNAVHLRHQQDLPRSSPPSRRTAR